MSRRFTRSRGSAGAPRRETLWAPIAPTRTAINGGGSALIASASASEDALRPYTVIRTHLYCSIVSDQVIASEDQMVAVGLAIVSDQASAIGITAVPTPITDLESDAWYLHQWLVNGVTFLDATSLQSNVNKSATWDSKAMRRVEDGFDNILVIEAPATISDGMDVILAGRQLLKLH